MTGGKSRLLQGLLIVTFWVSPQLAWANSMLELEFLFSIDVEGREDDPFNEEEIEATKLEITGQDHILSDGFFGELFEFDSHGSLVERRSAASLGLDRIRGFTTSLPNQIVIGGNKIGDNIFRYHVYDEDFNFLSSITPRDRFGELFSFPRARDDFGFDRLGRLVVTERSGFFQKDGAIHIFSPQGIHVQTIEADLFESDGNGSVSNPLAFDSQNRIYVGNSGLSRVQVYEEDGSFVTSYDRSEFAFSNNGLDLTILDDDSLLVSGDGVDFGSLLIGQDGTLLGGNHDLGYGYLDFSPARANNPLFPPEELILQVRVDSLGRYIINLEFGIGVFKGPMAAPVPEPGTLGLLGTGLLGLGLLYRFRQWRKT